LSPRYNIKGLNEEIGGIVYTVHNYYIFYYTNVGHTNNHGIM